MKSYQRQKKFITVFFFVVFLGGLGTLTLPSQEIFPFYSWFLFSLVPQDGDRYAVLIDEYHGRAMTPPCFYEEAEGIVSSPHAVTAQHIIQQLGSAEEAGKLEERDRFRRLLEQNYMPPPVRYELVRITFNPVERWKDGGRYRFKRIKTFSAP